MSQALYDGVHVHSRTETAEMLFERGLTARRLSAEGVRQVEEAALAKLRRGLAPYCRGSAMTQLMRALSGEERQVARAANGWARRRMTHEAKNRVEVRRAAWQTAS